MDDVRLPDLETIRRFSIAVRSEHAPAEEVLEALEQDIEKVQRSLRGRAPARKPATRSAASRSAASRSSGSRTTTSRSTRRR